MPYRRLSAVCLSTSCIVGVLALVPGIASADGGLASELGPGVSVTRQDETGKVGFIGTRPGDAIDVGLPASASAGKVARSFIDSQAKSFGLDGAGASLKVSGTDSTAGDGTAVHLQQFQDGLPVLGGELTVSLNADDQVLSVLGETSPSPSVSAAVGVSADEAIVAAVGTVAREKEVPVDELTASVPKLEVYDPRLLSAPGPLQQARTAWVLEVTSTDNTSQPIDVFTVVDAELGVVALHFDQVRAALNRSVCDAANTATRYPCAAPFARIEGQGATGDSDVDHAYDYAGDTYNFFSSRFGRDSLDGAGLPLLSTVRYCDPSESSCPYRNAFWDGKQMVYGQGFAAADDVVGHELTHGFTEFTSHLFYYAQSGAINESMSDVFGEYIDQTNAAGTDTAAVKWKLGEDIPGIGAIRDMKTPGTFGDPDRMTSANFTADVNETDGGGVHTNSGVNNKAAYLLADGSGGEPGGTFNGQTIGAIGITKAARIYYETGTAMLGSASDYADLGNALNQACTNLIGTDGITAGDCTSVAKSVQATEMATDPTNAPTVTAPVCTSGSPVDVFSDDLENPGSGNWTRAAIVGSNGWFYPQNSPSSLFDATYSTSGTTNFWGSNRLTRSDSAIRTTNAIAVPADAFLRFNHSYGFGDDSSAAYDGGVVEYSTAGAGGPWSDAGPLFDSASGYNGTISPDHGNPLAGRPAFVRESNGYGASRLGLSSLAGQNVMFRFRIGTDGLKKDYGWFIDDVRLYTCAESPPPPADPPADPPVAPPVANARIARVSVSGPARVKKGKKATFKVKISNSGDAAATGVKLRVRGRGVKAKKAAGRIAAGKSKIVRLKLKPKKPGKVRLTFKVSSRNAGGKTVKKKVRVRK